MINKPLQHFRIYCIYIYNLQAKVEEEKKKKAAELARKQEEEERSRRELEERRRAEMEKLKGTPEEQERINPNNWPSYT